MVLPNLLKFPRVKDIVGKIKSGVSAQRAGVRAGTLPVGPAAAGGILRAGGAAGKAFIQSLRQPKTLKNVLTGIGSRFGKSLGIATGAEAVRSAITDDPFGLNLRRVALGAAGYGVGGIPGLVAGSLAGGVQVGGRAGVGLVKDTAANLPGVQIRDFGPPLTFSQGDILINLPGGAPDVGIPPASFSAGFGAPAVNVGVGGTGLDFTTLALLGLIGGGGLFGAGVVAGKKKKKKKKKRSKRKKEDDDE